MIFSLSIKGSKDPGIRFFSEDQNSERIADPFRITGSDRGSEKLPNFQSDPDRIRVQEFMILFYLPL